jgi:hypothetical protein
MIDRRKFLGGAAALIGLPFLESLAPRAAKAQANSPPKRLLVFYFPNGMHTSHWIPETIGPDYQLERALSPLAPFRDRITVISNLDNPAAEEVEDGPHARGTGSFLTATRVLKSEQNLQNGLSLDQALVQNLAPETRFPSLQVGLEGGAYGAGCDAGFSCAYQRNISWAGPASPLAKIVSPSVMFDRLFAGTDAAASLTEAARRRRLEKSVLDAVLEEAHGIETALGSSDRRKLDEYFSGLRELERRIEPMSGSGSSCLAVEPDLTSRDLSAHARAMADLMVAAFQCDLTRFVTFMLFNSGANQLFDFIGVHGAHHDVSHHDDDPERLDQYLAINTWQVAQFAYLVERLAAIEEPSGTLLDNSLLLLSSEISDGNRHDHVNLPVVLAGSAGGALRPGRHIRAPDREPIANLFLAILHAFGVPLATFGDHGNAPLGGL